MRLLLDRREWLRLGGLGLALPALARASSSSGAPGFGKAKSVLLICTSGGMSQFETWDPKPNAPADIRGAFGTIATPVSGVRFGEHMPRIAKLADRFTVIRSVSHDDLDHGSACYLSLTGQFHPRKSSNPPPAPTDFPTYGAVLKRVRPSKLFPHTAVHVNGPLLAPSIPSPGQNAGFLGRGFEPLLLGDLTEDLPVLQGLTPNASVPSLRLETRRSLLESIEEASSALASNRVRLEKDALTRQAFELLSSPQHRRVFDLDQEPAKVRDRYGRNRSGQACLLGRRLVEAGVPLVTVFFNHGIRGQDTQPDDTDEYGWDTHNDIFEALQDHLLPRFDLGFSALMEDLEQRGLLNTTLVICMGEFGRAPLVALEPKFAGSTPGRKHWAACYSIVMAGAGVQRGATFGASDRMGAYPQANPVTPGDVVATLFNALGIDPTSHFLDGTERPYAITTGKPIAGIYG